MRIAFKFATAAMQGFMSVPRMRYPASHYVDSKGLIDESKVRSELSQNPGVQFSSDDNAAVLSFVVELLDRMRVSIEKLIAKGCGLKKTHNGDAKIAAERKFDRGKFAYVRMDARLGREAIRVKISTSNPKEVVGGTEEFCRYFAQALADNVMAIDFALRSEGTHIDVIEGDGCTGIVEAARKRVDDYVLRNRHKGCPNNRKGFCSPPVFDCELYSNGNCRYEEI